MKYIVLTVLLSFTILLSCKENKDTKVPVVESTDKFTQASQTMSSEDLINQLDGTWVSEDFFAAIEKNKAIYNNKVEVPSLFGFSILKDILVDGEDYLYGFSKHEAGYTWPVHYNKETMRLEYDKKRDDGNSPPATFYIKPLSENSLELVFTSAPEKRERYRKANLDEELSRILFAGSYTDKATGKDVTFTNDGKVTGLADKFFYMIQYDENEEYAVPFDAVTLYTDGEDEAGTTYHYKISGNTLSLFNVNAREVKKYIDYEYTVGSPAYTLIKH